MKTTRRSRREAKRLYRACIVGGLLDEGRARRVAQRVADSRRRGSLPILAHFQRLVRLDLARHLAVVESAVPLPPDILASVETGIARVYGAGTTTAVVHNPALIGGMRVQIGSDVYDGSVRAGLAALEERF
jgi:F-type H+-transporting ATPase subunit delta